jgi:hypothetical protein
MWRQFLTISDRDYYFSYISLASKYAEMMLTDWQWQKKKE